MKHLQKLPSWLNASVMRKWQSEAIDTRGDRWAIRFICVVKYFQAMLEDELSKKECTCQKTA